MVTEQEVYKRLKKVFDPELHINIVDLGLIYKVEVKDGEAHILMTLTFPGCPLGAVIHKEIKEQLTSLQGVRETKINITFDPPWDFSKVSEEAKATLGII